VRGTNPETGRPKPEPEQFYIDIDICMNCGYCAEYCPFDAIKMDHDYELASYDRTTNHIYDHAKLAKEQRYWESIAPTTAAEEMAARGGYDQTDVQKARKKAGLPASRPGPVSDKPEAAPAAAAAVATGAAPAEGVAAPAATAAPAAGDAPRMTPDGKVIVRRRGAGPKKEGGEAAATPAAAPAPTASDATPPVAAAAPEKKEAAPAAPAASAAPAEPTPSGMVQRGPKRVIDPNNPPPVVRRRNPPPKKE
jgi:NADH-quinone oxidoreductase subunit I